MKSKSSRRPPRRWGHARGIWRIPLALALFVVTFGRVGSAATTRVEVLAIGNNRLPIAQADSALRELRFADDDAAAFYEFAMHVADAGQLLTVMDRDTQALYPDLVRGARPPTTGEVTAAVAVTRQRIAEAAQRGVSTTVLVFFSGHGSLAATGEPELSLLDGGITRDFLYRQIIEQFPAATVHLLVDACHAEAVVRPRDSQAERVPVSAHEQTSFLLKSTLARYPNVGAILAAAGDNQTHEWDHVRQGVLTYELLSALRGGADVNRDGRIEYSEVYAFLSAANRSVDNPNARLFVVARPPDLDRRAALVDLRAFKGTSVARLAGIPATTSAWHIDDAAGRRLATVHGEAGFAVDLWLPSQRALYLRTADREARISPGSAKTIPFSDLRFGPVSERSRGALDEAVRRGLFSSTFGVGYYTGFIDQSSDFIAVTMTRDPGTTSKAPPSRRLPEARRHWLIGAGLSNAVAEQVALTGGLRLGLRPGAGGGLTGSIDMLYGKNGSIDEWRGGASLGWAWAIRAGSAIPYAGVSGGAGVIVQDSEGTETRSSPYGLLAPVLGAHVHVAEHVGLWGESQLSVMFYQRDGRAVASWAPEIWLGGSVGY